MMGKQSGAWRPGFGMAFLAGVGLLLVQLSSAAQQYSGWSTPVIMDPPINSSSFENLPALSKDGLSLYFSSNRPVIGPAGDHDLYVSQRVDENGPWGEPVNLGPGLNSPGVDSSATLSRDGHWLFFSSNREGGLGGFDLMVSWRRQTHDDFGWEAPVNLGPVVNSASDDAGCTFFEGANNATAELYFGSNRGGGPGGNDIYVTRLGEDGTFGPPVLVAELSSPLGDSRPQITHDGREMFLQSTRAGSIGGSIDIWSATRSSLNAPWSTPVNLAEINTSFGEFQHGISGDGLTLIFGSIRPDGFGGADFYTTTRTRGRAPGR